jgi:hypothetical protein
MQKTKETKKVVETKYTAEELVKIGKLLRHGDSMRIAEQCEMPYNGVARLFSGGEHNTGITNKATKSLLVIEKALEIIASYKIEAIAKQNSINDLIAKYDIVLALQNTTKVSGESENLAY